MTDPKHEQICPACGSVLEWKEDALGIVFQCHDMSCLELFDEDEIIEPDAPAPLRQQLQAKRKQTR